MSALRSARRRMSFLSLVLVSVFILSTEARADLYSFAAITDNSSVSGWMAQQLSLDVTDYGTTAGGVNQVLFTFINAVGPYDGIIGTVFFEDGALLALDADSIIENPPPALNPVDFEAGINPASKTFPAGGTLVPSFQTTAYFWATVDQSIHNGVNPGESVGIVFDLEDGKTFANVITAIGLGFTNPNPGGNTSLRVGVHVQNLPGYDEDDNWTQTDGSDSFILVPIPASVVLGILGLGVAGLKLRKFA